MPYRWVPRSDTAPQDLAPEKSGAFLLAPHPVEAELHLWPYRSLSAQGFVTFIAVTSAMTALPLLAALGTGAMWILLPFAGLAVTGVWWALMRSNRDARVHEVLTLDNDRAILVHRAADGSALRWEANPYWVTVTLYAEGGPVPDYLTLRGNDREVEIGAFLAPEERVALYHDLHRVLASLR